LQADIGGQVAQRSRESVGSALRAAGVHVHFGEIQVELRLAAATLMRLRAGRSDPAARIETDRVTMAFKIPWKAFGGKPSAGDVWLGNLYRAVGAGDTRGYLAWSPTMTKEPQFHVPEKFGEFVFVN